MTSAFVAHQARTTELRNNLRDTEHTTPSHDPISHLQLREDVAFAEHQLDTHLAAAQPRNPDIDDVLASAVEQAMIAYRQPRMHTCESGGKLRADLSAAIHAAFPIIAGWGEAAREHEIACRGLPITRAQQETVDRLTELVATRFGITDATPTISHHRACGNTNDHRIEWRVNDGESTATALIETDGRHRLYVDRVDLIHDGSEPGVCDCTQLCGGIVDEACGETN